MKRRSTRVDVPSVVTEEVVVAPAAETIVVTPVPGRVGPLLSTVSTRVGPLAHTAAQRINATAVLVSPYAQSAAQRVAPAAKIAAARVAPLAQSAAHQVGPLAQQAVTRVSPYAVHAVQLVTPYAQQAQQAAGRVGPLATSVTSRGTRVAQDAVDTWRPKLSSAVEAAATAPVVVEATRRSKATLAAARGELSLPEPIAPVVPVQATGWLKRLGPYAAAAGLAGLAAYVVRSLGHREADWQAARPSTPYAPSSSSPTSAAGDNLDAPRIDVPVSPGDLDGSASTVPGVTDASGANYAGEGVYVGSEPPAAFVIKGNERSMKYHTPASPSYNETTAEVWFSSEEAAVENGFTQAHA